MALVVVLVIAMLIQTNQVELEQQIKVMQGVIPQLIYPLTQVEEVVELLLLVLTVVLLMH